MIFHKTRRQTNLFDKDYLISTTSTIGSHFGVSYYLADQAQHYFLSKLRLLAENCSNLEGFMITHSLCGGTGSGFSTKILEKITDEYGFGKVKSRDSNE